MWRTRVAALVATADKEAAYQGDLRKPDWAQAAVHLAAFTDAEITARAAALSVAQRASLLAGCAPGNHRLRRPLLDLDLRAAIAANDWPRAATVLTAFNDPDIVARVRALSRARRIDLYVPAVNRVADPANVRAEIFWLPDVYQPRLVYAPLRSRSTTLSDRWSRSRARARGRRTWRKTAPARKTDRTSQACSTKNPLPRRAGGGNSPH